MKYVKNLGSTFDNMLHFFINLNTNQLNFKLPPSVMTVKHFYLQFLAILFLLLLSVACWRLHRFITAACGDDDEASQATSSRHRKAPLENSEPFPSSDETEIC
jgi:hypothetical protein